MLQITSNGNKEARISKYLPEKVLRNIYTLMAIQNQAGKTKRNPPRFPEETRISDSIPFSILYFRRNLKDSTINTPELSEKIDRIPRHQSRIGSNSLNEKTYIGDRSTFEALVQQAGEIKKSQRPPGRFALKMPFFYMAHVLRDMGKSGRF